MIDSSSVRVEERLTDNGVVVVQVFGEPLLGYGLLIELDISLCEEVVVGLITCGGELVVLWTRLLSGSAHGCCLLTSRKVKSRRKCWKLKMMKRRKVNEMERSKRESLHVRMRHGYDDGMNEAQTRALELLSHSVMCKESNEDDTKETLQNKQRALTSLQLVYSCVFTCFRFASTLNMLLCLFCAFVSSFQSSSMFPDIDFSPVCEFLVIVHTAKTGLLRCCLYTLPSVTVDRRQL